jgi:hypothetical protein
MDQFVDKVAVITGADRRPTRLRHARRDSAVGDGVAAMSGDAVYRIASDVAEAGPHAAGPWDPSLQHGSGPAALVARAAERLDTPTPMRVARLTLDLIRPVPVAPLEIRAAVTRQGRRIQAATIVLLTDGVEVVRASVLKVRVEAGLAAAAAAPPLDLPGPEHAAAPGDAPATPSPFLSGIAMRVGLGSVSRPGPAAVWFRADRPIVEGEASTPLMRAVLTADFCNGLSAPLDPADWTFINGDLSVSLAREPIGDWIVLDAETWIGPHGAALACGRLGDRSGYFGRVAQTLVIERRQHPTTNDKDHHAGLPT